ncbi:MAG: leucine-rich repeat domain-containing protein [Bacteroidia bacterium]
MQKYYTKILFIFVFISFHFSFAKAQLVYVPDTGFRNELISQGFGSCFVGDSIDPSCPLVSNCDSLFINYPIIYDITGIEAFVTLTYFYLVNSYVSLLPALPPNLTYLACPNNELTSVTALPLNLSEFYCDGNQLTSLPSLPNSLTVLQCSFNQLTSLPALPSGLIELQLHDNQLTSLPSIPSAIYDFRCYNNQLTSIPPLPAILDYFDCSQNNLTSLPALPVNLWFLNCSYNALTFISSFPSDIQYLYCANNQLTSLPALPANNFKELYCSYNLLTALPPLPASSLSYGLYCDNNLLSTLPSFAGTWIRFLSCQNNQLTALPALTSNLEEIYCQNNQLTSLPALPNDLLKLYCGNNPLTSIPELPSVLNNFDCSNSPLLTCLPFLKTIGNFNFTNTGINCLPNYGNVTSSNPLLSSVPLCDIFNSNNCNFYWNISGKSYFDFNTDCIFNGQDINQQNLPLLLYKDGNLIQQTLTGGEGLYSFNTDSVGVYSVTADTTNIPFDVLCPANETYNDTINATDSLFYNNDFALKCKNGFDLGIQSISGGFRPATYSTLKISAGDMASFFGMHCANGINGTLTTVLSGPVTYISAAPGAQIPSLVSGDTIIYSVSDFGNINFINAFSIILQTDTGAALGAQVCINVTIDSVAGDYNLNNNSLQNCFTVVSSFDPNDKQVYPSGSIDTTQQWLTYTINFQNTGTAIAQHIYILDTLDNNLDESTFTLLSYSHHPLTQIIGNVARFNFPNINLPDSTNDEPNSHGYVQYKVKLKNGLPIGTTISNTANIIFDFNAPVATNTVTNQIQMTTGNNLFTFNHDKINIYPNPARNFIYINYNSKENQKAEFTLFNSLSQKIKSTILFSNGKTQSLNTSDLPSGIYFWQVKSQEQDILNGKFVVLK